MSGDGLQVHIDGGGVLRQLCVDDDDLIISGPVPNLWRAPTDNDEFGRFADGWRNFGLHNTRRVVENMRAWQPMEDLISIQVDWRLMGANNQRLGTVMFAYLITADKQVELCCHMYIEVSGRSVGGQEEPPPTLPRLGLSLQVPKRYQSAQWYGLGPFENYPDRRSSARLGHWRLPVQAMHTPYVVPSENGGRGGVRWIALSEHDELVENDSNRRTDAWRSARRALAAAIRAPIIGDALEDDLDDAGREDPRTDASTMRPLSSTGLLLAAGPLTPPLQASVSPYSNASLTTAKHDSELVPSSDSVHVHLDVQHMGVGGHDSWTPLHTVGERYFVSPVQRTFFRIRMTPLSPNGIGSGQIEPSEAAQLVSRPIVHSGTVVMLRALPETVLPSPQRGANAMQNGFQAFGMGKNDFRFDFSEFASAAAAVEGEVPPLQDGSSGGGGASVNGGGAAAAGGADASRNAIDVYQSSSSGYIDWASKAAGASNTQQQQPSAQQPQQPQPETPGSVCTDSESECTDSSSRLDSPSAFSPPAAPGSGGGAKLLAGGVSPSKADAVNREAYLLVGQQVGVAPLPAMLPSASRYFAGLVVEKSGGGPVHTQTTVTLRGCNGYCVEVESEAVCARWTIAGEWQSFTIEACEEGPERLLRHGDVICLRAHTGKLVRCPNRAAVGRENGASHAPLEATAWSHEEAQRFEVMLC